MDAACLKNGRWQTEQPHENFETDVASTACWRVLRQTEGSRRGGGRHRRGEQSDADCLAPHGSYVSAGDRATLASVPERQRKSFEVARETIKTITRAMDTDRQHRIAHERLAQGQKKDKGISR